MKKTIFLIFLSFLILNVPKSNAMDYSTYCSTITPKTTFGGNVASVSGFNSISRNIIENKIQKALKKETNSKFKVKVDNFRGTNILNGEFKNLSAVSDLVQYGGIYFSDVKINSLCDYNKVSYTDKKLLFDENLVLKYSTKITQQNLDKTLSESGYKKLIEKFNQDKVASSLFKITNAKVLIKNDRLELNYEFTPFPKTNLFDFAKNIIKPVKISMGANLKVVDNKIELCDFDLNNIKSSYYPIVNAINSFNLLKWSMPLSDDVKGKVQVENVKIENSTINIDGVVLVPKNNSART